MGAESADGPGVQGRVEAQPDAVVADLVRDEYRRAAHVAEPLEATIVGGVGLPTGDAGDIEVPVLGVEATLLRPGEEIRRDALRGPLPLAADLLSGHHQRGASPEGEVDEVAGAAQRGPRAVRQEDLTGAGIVLAPRQVKQGRLGRLARLGPAIAEVGTLILAQLHLYDGRSGGPIAFLQAGREEAVIRGEAGAVRIAQAGRQDLDALRAGQAQHALVAGGGVEAPLGVGLQADHVIVAALGSRIAVRHALVEVGLVVAVEVVEARDLVTSEHMDATADHLDAQRLVQSGGETLPTHLPQFRIEPAHEPDLTGHRGDRGRAIGQEIQPAQEHQRAIGIGERHRDGIVGERTPHPHRPDGLDPGRPLRRSTLREVRELGGRLRPAPGGSQEVPATLGIAEDRLRPMPIEPTVDGVLRRLSRRPALDDLPKQTPAVVEAMAHLAELDEAAAPLEGEGQGDRVEARAAITLADAHRLRNRQTLAAEDP